MSETVWLRAEKCDCRWDMTDDGPPLHYACPTHAAPQDARAATLQGQLEVAEGRVAELKAEKDRIASMVAEACDERDEARRERDEAREGAILFAVERDDARKSLKQAEAERDRLRGVIDDLQGCLGLCEECYDKAEKALKGKL